MKEDVDKNLEIIIGRRLNFNNKNDILNRKREKKYTTKKEPPETVKKILKKIKNSKKYKEKRGTDRIKIRINRLEKNLSENKKCTEEKKKEIFPIHNNIMRNLEFQPYLNNNTENLNTQIPQSSFIGSPFKDYSPWGLYNNIYPNNNIIPNNIYFGQFYSPYSPLNSNYNLFGNYINVPYNNHMLNYQLHSPLNAQLSPFKNNNNNNNAINFTNDFIYPMSPIFNTENNESKTKKNENNKKVLKTDLTIKDCKIEYPICSICLEEIKLGEEIGKLACKHFFHINCCNTWIDIKPNCPICRININEEKK